MEKVKGSYDFVVSRAVAPAKQLYNWTKKLISSENNNHMKNGWLLLKGGDLKSELKQVKLRSREINISEYFNEDFFETKKVVYLKAE